jgi:hypothetical protein
VVAEEEMDLLTQQVGEAAELAEFDQLLTIAFLLLTQLIQ